MTGNLEIITGKALRKITDKEEIGRGHFGIVYKAQWRGKKVAILELKSSDFSQSALDDFQRECQMMAKLRCNYLVRLYAITQDPYGLMMEFMDGGALCERLQLEKGVISWNQRYRWALQVGKGIEFLHAASVFHGDIKCDNVFLNEKNQAKLGNQVLSKLWNSNKSSATGSVKTYPWMAPELLDNAKYTLKSDVYSYGIFLREITIRKEPFTEVEMKMKSPIPIQTVKGGSNLEIPEDTPKAYGDIIKSCCDVNPNKRPTIKEVVSMLVQETITVFGGYQWNTVFGDPGLVPPLPDDIYDILSGPCPFWEGKSVEETHLLVLIPATLDGKPFTINGLKDMIERPKQGSTNFIGFIHEDIVKEYGDRPYECSRWVLMTSDVIEGTRGKDFKKQKEIVKKIGKQLYQVPTLLEVLTCIFTLGVISGTKLYSCSDNTRLETYTNCQEASKGYQVSVGGYYRAGLSTPHLWVFFLQENHRLGLVGIRKF